MQKLILLCCCYCQIVYLFQGDGSSLLRKLRGHKGYGVIARATRVQHSLAG